MAGRPPGNHYLEPASQPPTRKEVRGGWVSESFARTEIVEALELLLPVAEE